MDKDSLKPLIETIVFAADHPISFERLMNVLEGEQREEVRAALNEIINEYASSGRGFVIEEAFQDRLSEAHQGIHGDPCHSGV